MALRPEALLTAPKPDVRGLADFIAGIQRPDGEIPWSEGGKTDPWDHVESAMGLSVAGFVAEARRAFRWLAGRQLPDGSWYSAYAGGEVLDRTRETHFAAYLAVGVYHHYLITRDVAFVREMWEPLRKGIDFALSLQTPAGEIYWALDAAGRPDPKALLTGCSSIYLSLRCALELASLVGAARPDWICALAKLGGAIGGRPDLFDRTKARFSMDWYYPVLCGAVTGAAARGRIERGWDIFVIPRWGVRCVSDRPWVTMAETSELVIALAALGDCEEALEVFCWLADKRYEDGPYWMGVTVPDGVVWPEEKTSWTAAAVLLAYDAVSDLTPAARLFRHRRRA
ncbi:MAG TPA: hypothetical protein P5269_06445 [Syntrophales bacterium]|nr:hypothetical protein [Syntrophales bacterium]